MSRPMIGHGPGDVGYAFSFVRNDGTVEGTFYVSESSARWMHGELTIQLGVRDVIDENDKLRERVARLERSNAALRGALARKRGTA